MCVNKYLSFPRCQVGDDWWYYGNTCQFKGSNQDKTNLALASSLSVLGAMLIITVISVVCVKKKYKKPAMDLGFSMENAHANGKA